MTDDLIVKLHRNDGSETFNLKAESVDPTVSNGLVTDSVISGVSRKVLGGKLVLDMLSYQIDFVVQGMEPADYPNSSSYSDHDKGFRDELMRASQEWGYDTSDGFDVLEYDGRSISGVITEFNPTEDTSSRVQGTYQCTLEWTHLDAYVS